LEAQLAPRQKFIEFPKGMLSELYSKEGNKFSVLLKKKNKELMFNLSINSSVPGICDFLYYKI